MAVACIEQPVGTVFPEAFTHFLSLGHIVIILAIFQTLHKQKDWLAEGSEDGEHLLAIKNLHCGFRHNAVRT